MYVGGANRWYLLLSNVLAWSLKTKKHETVASGIEKQNRAVRTGLRLGNRLRR